MSFYLIKPCRGKAAFEAIPKVEVQIDLKKGLADLRGYGYEVTDAGVMLVAVKGELQVSIYPSGKLLIQTTSREEASEVANGIFDIFGMGKGI